MANIFELNINVNFSEKTETEQALKETETGALDGSGGDSDSAKGGDSKSSKSSTKALVGLYVGKKAVQFAKAELQKQMSFQTQLLTARYGDTVRTNEVNNLMETGGFALSSLGGAVTTGAALGSVAGPVGAAVGMVVSFALSVTAAAFDANRRMQLWEIENQNYTREENYAMERLGVLAASKGR